MINSQLQSKGGLSNEVNLPKKDECRMNPMDFYKGEESAACSKPDKPTQEIQLKIRKEFLIKTHHNRSPLKNHGLSNSNFTGPIKGMLIHK